MGSALEKTNAGDERSDGGRPMRQPALLVALAASSLACSSVNGAIFRPDMFHSAFDRFHFRTTALDRKRRAELATIVGELPARARVAASETIVPHISNREDAYTLGFGTVLRRFPH